MRASETTTPPAIGVAPPESPVPAPRATNGTPLSGARAQHGLDVLGRAGQDDELGHRAVSREPVALVDAELLRLREDVLRAQRRAQLVDECGGQAHVAEPSSARSGRRRGRGPAGSRARG